MTPITVVLWALAAASWACVGALISLFYVLIKDFKENS